MSDLERFAEHARRMAVAEHAPECEAIWHETQYTGGLGISRREKPNPHCPGCVTAADRELWAALAVEVDAYLAPDDGPDLFGTGDGLGGNRAESDSLPPRSDAGPESGPQSHRDDDNAAEVGL